MTRDLGAGRSGPASPELTVEPTHADFDTAEVDDLTAEISLTNIEGAAVVHALVNGALERLEQEAAKPDDIPVTGRMTTAQAKHLLKTLRSQFPSRAEREEVVLDDQQLDGIPSLPGFRPFARVIQTETIVALDGRYGEGFTRQQLAELVRRRDQRAITAGTAGPSIVAATLEAPGAMCVGDEQDQWADTPDNEFGYRWRDFQLYVGDIPFNIWYSLLHGAAARFLQQLRSQGQTDLPDVAPIHPNDLRDHLAAAKAEGRPLVMRTSTRLPILTSWDTDLDVRAINRTFHQLGYPGDRNFLYDALYPALEAAPLRRGRLCERRPIPAPHVPEGRDLWVSMAQDTSTVLRRHEGHLVLSENGPTDTTGLARSTTGGAPATASRVPLEPEYDDYDEPGGEEAEAEPILKPSGYTLARIHAMNVAMDETEGLHGMWEWTGMYFVQRPLLAGLFVLQRVVRR